MWLSNRKAGETMLRTIKKWMRNCHGFSLVEAIISVAIVGIAMVPISMIFSQTIAQSIEMRKQLQANTLVQEYVENLKTRTPANFNNFFNGATAVTLDSTLDDEAFTNKGLKPLPKGYEVTLSYSKAPFNPPPPPAPPQFDFNLPIAEIPIPVDFIVAIPSGKYEDTIIKAGNGTIIASIGVGTSMTNDRQLLIRVGRTNSQYEVIYQRINGTNEASINIPRVLNSIRFEMGNKDINEKDTNIAIDSSTSDHLQIHVYEGADNTVKATTEVINGLVTFNRNLSLPGAFTQSILKITAEIKDTTSGKILASVTTTKVDE